MKAEYLQEIGGEQKPDLKYSVCTLVTNLEEYQEMAASFISAGFALQTTEFLYINNSASNNLDAYQGINLFLRRAKGEYIILCHQDILLDKDDETILGNRLEELEKLDKNWAVCGNAGGAGPNHIVYRISYPGGVFKQKGRFPAKVSSLDENFITVKSGAMLAVSNDLEGFHFYGTDLCLHAELRGFSAYAIAFNLTHKSYGNPDEGYSVSKKKFVKKYSRFFRSRWIQTPITVMYLSGSLFNPMQNNPAALFITRMWNGFKKKLN